MTPSHEPETPSIDRTGPSPFSAHSVEFLRIGIGLVWFVNLLFIVVPSNHYFANFSTTALSFASTSAGGPWLAHVAADHPLEFAWLIASVTAYLTVAFLLGITVRVAAVVGSAFSAVLLATQIGSTFYFPGGTDVGEHPLYILIYAVLVVGGAGRALTFDAWVRSLLARRAAAGPALRVPAVSWWTSSVSSRTVLTYFVAGTMLSFGVGLGLVLAIPPTPGPAPAALPPGPAFYENLTINVNQTNGWPQYSPANFTVPAGRVIFTIVDNDAPMNWSGCSCIVLGTANNLELVNGTSTHVVSPSNVAHSFSIPKLGIQTWSPGLSTVQFSAEVTPGNFLWICEVPCGTGTDPYTSPPMGVLGSMTGYMTVT